MFMEEKKLFLVSLSGKEKETLDKIVSFEENLKLDIVCTMEVIAGYYMQCPIDDCAEYAKKAMDQIVFLSEIRQIIENVLPICEQIKNQVGTVDYSKK